MKITSLKYFIKEAFVNLLKNGLMSVASIITVASCVFILITSYSIAANVDYMIKNIESQIGLTVFINDSVTSSEIKSIYTDLMNTEHVKDVVFISSEDAYNNFKESLEESSHILDGLPSETLLPRSLEIYLDDNEYIDVIIRKLQPEVGEDKFFSSISHGEKEADIIASIGRVIRIVSTVLVIGLGFIGTVIIMNTIKITVNTRKSEINLMKYVGATDWFIRWPFIFEGILIGFIGAFIPIVISYFSYSRIVSKITENLAFANNLFVFKSANELFLYSTPLALCIGVLIGVLGSTTSIRKHLNV